MIPQIEQTRTMLNKHLQEKTTNDGQLNNDPILNHPNEFKTSIDQILSTHQEAFHNNGTNAALVMLGNSFSWQAHMINHFSNQPPTAQWGQYNAIVVPYSSSFLVENNGTYNNRPHPKGQPNEETKEWALSHLPNTPFSLIDMVKTGAGLASFLFLLDISPEIIVFEPNTPLESSITTNSFFTSKSTHRLPINPTTHDHLESMCDDGIRGSIQTKIYKPKPTEKHPALFYVKKSRLIHTMTALHQN